jgi:molecular chaperone DnaK (HSP70)
MATMIDTWNRISGMLHEPTCNVLHKTLEQTAGSDWWDVFVVPSLQGLPSGNSVLDSIPDKKLSRFDFGVVLDLLSLVCSEWVNLSNIDDDAGITVRSVIAFHKAVVDGADINERQLNRYKNSIIDFAGLLSFGDELVESVTSLCNQLGVSKVNQEGSNSDDQDGLPLFFQGGRYAIDPSVLTHQSTAGKYEYVGLDFGTSTSIVTRAVVSDSVTQIEPIFVPQPDDYGDEITSKTVNTCLALVKKQLIFGVDAYRVRRKLVEGETVFSSFKMRLGVDLGPIYVRSKLDGSLAGLPVINSAQSATSVFMKSIIAGASKALECNKSGRKICLTVTVPASFESNQRKDLLASLKNAGIDNTYLSLVDEPNAAFIATVYDYLSSDPEFITSLQNQRRNVLVYDFGAGTCDVSLLGVELVAGTKNNCFELLVSNIALSRFMALGGDDIDKWIAENVLLQQIREQVTDGFTATERDELIVPWLASTAEQLKKVASEHVGELLRQERRPEDDDAKLVNNPTSELTINGVVYKLSSPTITTNQFMAAINAFRKNPVIGSEQKPTLTAPVENVLSKSRISSSDIDYVLFIGGSSQNAMVRKVVMDLFTGQKAVALVPGNLQEQVSRGAAIHSMLKWHSGIDVIKPIVSENVYVVTRGGGLKLLVPQGTQAPSKASEYLLYVPDGGLHEIQLPICVGDVSKLLHVVTLRSQDNKEFVANQKIRIIVSLTTDKEVFVQAETTGAAIVSEFMNPLSNAPITRSRLEFLAVQKEFNRNYSFGKADYKSIARLAVAAERASDHERAADLYVQAHNLANGRANYATNICYCYGKAKNTTACFEWAQRAYSLDTTSVNAYNYAIKFDEGHPRRQELLEESIKLDPKLDAALVVYACDLKNQDNPEWTEYAERALSVLLNTLGSLDASPNDIVFAKMLVEFYESEDLQQRIDKAADYHRKVQVPYNAEKLAQE